MRKIMAGLSQGSPVIQIRHLHSEGQAFEQKKPVPLFQATRLSFSRSAAFRAHLTMVLAFSEFFLVYI
jgi:hypothetical protein